MVGKLTLHYFRFSRVLGILFCDLQFYGLYLYIMHQRVFYMSWQIIHILPCLVQSSVNSCLPTCLMVLLGPHSGILCSVFSSTREAWWGIQVIIKSVDTVSSFIAHFKALLFPDSSAVSIFIVPRLTWESYIALWDC